MNCGVLAEFLHHFCFCSSHFASFAYIHNTFTLSEEVWGGNKRTGKGLVLYRPVKKNITTQGNLKFLFLELVGRFLQTIKGTVVLKRLGSKLSVILSFTIFMPLFQNRENQNVLLLAFSLFVSAYDKCCNMVSVC